LLNKLANQQQQEHELKRVPLIKKKRKSNNKPVEIKEVQLLDENTAYEIQFLSGSTENAEIELVEIPKTNDQFTIISEELIEVSESKSSIQQQRNESGSENYFRVLDDNDKIKLDENGEKKIFQCTFSNCTETFSRRQQTKTHYFNHLAVGSQYVCKYCSKKFKVQSALERHERVHNNSKVKFNLNYFNGFLKFKIILTVF
jgi:uncharacterized Zn-finger protein